MDIFISQGSHGNQLGQFKKPWIVIVFSTKEVMMKGPSSLMRF
jgi:hypothetical protein